MSASVFVSEFLDEKWDARFVKAALLAATRVDPSVAVAAKMTALVRSRFAPEVVNAIANMPSVQLFGDEALAGIVSVMAGVNATNACAAVLSLLRVGVGIDRETGEALVHAFMLDPDLVALGAVIRQLFLLSQEARGWALDMGVVEVLVDRGDVKTLEVFADGFEAGQLKVIAEIETRSRRRVSGKVKPRRLGEYLRDVPRLVIALAGRSIAACTALANAEGFVKDVLDLLPGSAIVLRSLVRSEVFRSVLRRFSGAKALADHSVVALAKTAGRSEQNRRQELEGLLVATAALAWQEPDAVIAARPEGIADFIETLWENEGAWRLDGTSQLLQSLRASASRWRGLEGRFSRVPGLLEAVRNRLGFTGDSP